MSTVSVADVLQSTSNRINSDRKISSKEQAEALPQWLLAWCQNPKWAIRLSKLLIAGYETELRQSISYIEGRKDISFKQWYFNSMWSRVNIERTLTDMRRLIETTKLVEQVQKIIKVADKHRGALFAACKRWGGGVIRHAVTAEEIGKDKFKFFCWLTSKKQKDEYFKQLAEQGVAVAHP